MDARGVFVIGSPRSGTTFLGGAVGSLPGFVDLGEVAVLKAEIPELSGQRQEQAGRRVRRILTVTGKLGLVGGLRPVEHTPEVAFINAAAAEAFEDAQFLHIVRDGRDVVCSLVERGWLSEERTGGDDAGHPFGSRARFWVEPGREDEFVAASDVARAAWAWRRYVTAAQDAPADRLLELRYETLIADPAGVAESLAGFLDAPLDPLITALRRAHGESIGRWREGLSASQLAEVEHEAGELLTRLGYVD